MADTKISDLPAVTTPAATDEFAVNQGGTSKKETRAQIHTLESGEHLVLPAESDAVTPTITLGVSGSGIYAPNDTQIQMSIGGVQLNAFASAWIIRDTSTTGPGLLNEGASATNPTAVPSRGDVDTGIGGNNSDQLSIIAGGVEGLRLTEVSSAIIHSCQADIGLTAHTDSIQGAGVILSSYNVYSTVGTTGDAATLPAVFTIDPSTVIYVKNDGANSMDIFPANGDDAGAGADTAVAVAAGDFAVFMATAANSTWTKIMGGTA